jgi:hypothetical protein
MSQMNMIQAIRSAHDIMLEKDPSVVAFGQDIGYFGGVFRCTDGLQQKYGEHRVIDAPIAEGGIVATAIGLGINGLRPVVEIPDRQRTVPVALSQRRRFFCAGHHPHTLRRRHPRRADAFSKPGRYFHAPVRGQNRHGFQSL